MSIPIYISVTICWPFFNIFHIPKFIIILHFPSPTSFSYTTIYGLRVPLENYIRFFCVLPIISKIMFICPFISWVHYSISTGNKPLRSFHTCNNIRRVGEKAYIFIILIYKPYKPLFIYTNITNILITMNQNPIFIIGEIFILYLMFRINNHHFPIFYLNLFSLFIQNCPFLVFSKFPVFNFFITWLNTK